MNITASADKKRVLITGAAGFIGSHLTDRYLKEGWQVIGMDNLLTGSMENIAHNLGNENFTFVKYNVTNYIHVEGKVDLVLHFACPASPVDYLNYPIQTLKVDSIGTMHSLGLAKEKKARYVFASTSEIYGDPEVHPQPESYWGNVNPLGPRSVYDEAKRFSESMTVTYHRKHGVDARIVRIFNTYGPRMRLNDGRIIPNFVYQALTGKPITVYGDGSQTRSFCYIEDLVEGIYRVSTMEGISGEVFNLGNTDEYTVKSFAEIITDNLQASGGLVYEDLPQDDPKRRCPDITKAKKVLGWEPKVSLDDGLRETVDYFREAIEKIGE
ncbi:UDP-glucuronic acid decarboxylase family protein [Limisalsivibrio acetivorans]|uniref:UDP-glucuronic acid decarboxylase family protein n=1 Tax=Limisalsivibrio acetivorans TaxID=1304888 RepID=UPI0003B73096|nr:UDP-glucuronic acid decarboxylase family protein [Limisalsivibrio acetivorans]